jgi:hypothetical protein
MQFTTDVPPNSEFGILTIAADLFLFFVVIGLFYYFLNKSSQSKKLPDTGEMKPSLSTLVLLLLLIALFAPSHLNIYPSHGHISYYLIGMCWQIIELSLAGFVFSFLFFLVGLPFTFLRLVFVYQIYKYYLGTSSKKRVVITGIIAELQLFLIGLAIIPIGLSEPLIAVVISLPIPILLLVGLVVIHSIQRTQEDTKWTGFDEEKDWWEEQEEAPNE